MNKKLLSLAFAFFVLQYFVYGQNNTYPWPSSGNIGIGTTSPSGKLDVYGNMIVGSTNGKIDFRRGDGTIGGRLGFTDTQFYLVNTSANSIIDFSLNTGGGVYEHIRFDNNGYLGIGTTSPATKLEVNGTGSSTSINIQTNGRIKSNSVDGGVWLSNANDGFVGNNNVDNNIGFWTDSASWAFVVNKTTGNVGIGTTTPLSQAKLHIYSLNPLLYMNTLSGGAAAIRLCEGTDFRGGFVAYDEATNILNIGVHDNTGTNTAHDKFALSIVRANGRVGIGTPNPESELAVNGTITTKEIKVKNTIQGADFVFEQSYNLPTLNEIESYIKTHKHLPEVPSAKEMQEEGLDLGEMNILLLQKIEELTLHLIEQNRQNEQQSKEIEYLKLELEKNND